MIETHRSSLTLMKNDFQGLIPGSLPFLIISVISQIEYLTRMAYFSCLLIIQESVLMMKKDPVITNSDMTSQTKQIWLEFFLIVRGLYPNSLHYTSMTREMSVTLWPFTPIYNFNGSLISKERSLNCPTFSNNKELNDGVKLLKYILQKYLV